MTKILYLCETLGIGGAEQLLFTTLKYLNRDNFYSIVYCIGKNGKIGDDIEKIGIRVEALNRKLDLWNIGIIWKLVQIFKREKPDVLHCHLFYANYFGRIATFFVKIPIVIITEHGTHSNFKKFYHHGIDFILSLFTNRIIAVSKAVKEYLCKYTSVSPDKISVIYNTIDFEKFEDAYSTDKPLVRKKLGFADSNILIGSVSNLAPWKGQYFLLQAFAEVVKFFSQAKLCIVGRNNAGFQSQLEAFTKNSGIQDSVYFLGERRDIPQLMRAFDIFVLPSLTEGLGVSLLEAMYMGLPAVASNIEGIPEIIEDNKDGFLVPAGNSHALAERILMLLSDTDKIKSIGSKARDKIQRYFLPENYLEKLEAVYNR